MILRNRALLRNAYWPRMIINFPPGVPREHVRSINHHRRGRAARDIHRAIRACAPSDLSRRGAVDLRNARCAGFLMGAASCRARAPFSVGANLREERTLSAELPGYDDYRRRRLSIDPAHLVAAPPNGARVR